MNEEKSCVSKANEAVSEFALRIAGAAPAASDPEQIKLLEKGGISESQLLLILSFDDQTSFRLIQALRAASCSAFFLECPYPSAASS